MVMTSDNFSKYLMLLANSYDLIIEKETIELFYLLRGESFTTAFLTSSIVEARRLATIWDLHLEPALNGGVQSLCFKGYTQNGLPVVLKIPSVPQEGLLEVQALKIWSNHSELKVLKEDSEGKGFLMSYIENKPRVQKVEEIVIMTRNIYSTEQQNGFKNIFPQMNKFMEAKILSTEKRFINSLNKQKYDKNLELAKNIYKSLLKYQQLNKMQTLLHGDMKKHNILATKQGLVAIDPQPCLGDELYDIATWIAGSVHNEPINTILSQFLSEDLIKSSDRLFLWTWVLAVTENRPNHKPYAFERETFIDDFYEKASQALKSFKAM